MSVPNVNLWSTYLNYIRRTNDLSGANSDKARNTIIQAYEFSLTNIGMDRDAGRIWQDYIQFIRSGPGQIGGTNWQDQLKMDQLRKAYQRAVCIPMSNVNALWKEYDQFEMGLNRITGRKFLQEKSPSYMTARSANTHLENITRGLERTNLPRLPPALGFEGDKEYLHQVELWNQWINWEKDDPLVLKDEDLEAYKARVLYAYKQAVMALRFWPEMWVDAAEWAFSNGMEVTGNDFLTQGIAANPESCLLAFKHADRLETVLPIEEGDEGLASRGASVRAPYNRCLDALYELLTKLKHREAADVAKIEAAPTPEGSDAQDMDDDDDDESDTPKKPKKSAKEVQIEAVKHGYSIQSKLVQRTLSFVWIALMRAMRRTQGKGKVGALVGGSRQILNDARLRGRITSDVYVASALIEHIVYKDPAGTKIFERGAKLFPEDEVFILEYLKHLLSIGDTTSKSISSLHFLPHNANMHRCSCCLRNIRQPPGAEAREHGQGQAALRLLPQIRVRLRRALPNRASRGPHGRALPRRPKTPPFLLPLHGRGIQPNHRPPNHQPICTDEAKAAGTHAKH